MPGTQTPRRKDHVKPAGSTAYALLDRPVDQRIDGTVTIDGQAIDSPAAFKAAKETMVKSDLRVSRLYEMAGHLRWATVGAMGMTLTALSLGSGLQGGWFAATSATQLIGALGAAMTTWPFIACAALTIAVGAVSLAVTQRARKVSSERAMDVGAFMQERGAELTGKAVAKATGTNPVRADGKSWASVIREEQAGIAASYAR